MSNPVGLPDTVLDVEQATVGNLQLAVTGYHTFFTAVFFFRNPSDILLVWVAAICGEMETLRLWWTECFSPAVFVKETEMMPRSTLGFIITLLVAFTEIKSQGQTGFPFQTHPQAIMISVTTLLIYGLASAAEHLISAAYVDSTSVFTIIARLGRIGSLCILGAKDTETA